MEISPALELEERRPRISAPQRLGLLVRRNPLGLVGALIILALVVAAVFAPLIAPYGPNDQESEIFLRPNGDHWFGTDRFGRDIFSRIVFGARISLTVGLASVGAGTAVGAFIGILSGYFGGRLDNFIQRSAETAMAFPGLILLLIIIAALGASIQNVVIAIGVGIVPGVQRVVRGAVLSEKQNMYIEAARALGASDARILFRHLLPNVLALIVVLSTLLLGGAILAEAGLSFLGLGVPPPNPSWGADLSGQARAFFQKAPWMAIFPGAAISLTVLGFNLLGDSIRDILDPRLRGRGGL
jgi:ABC-type dipeptide/oligopeptide/nickel transport system permease subunit